MVNQPCLFMDAKVRYSAHIHLAPVLNQMNSVHTLTQKDYLILSSI
jgi:hypothetical protein